MPASKPSTIACQSEPRQSLRQRAASLRAAAARYTSLTPTNLAEACAWATAHRVWLDEGQNLGDAGLDIELQRIDTVFDRATSEPSRSPCETIAKARMLLDDLHRSGSLSASSDHRLIPVVLQELLALADTIAGDREPGATTEGHGLPDVRFGPLGFDASAKSLETLQSLHGVASALNDMCDALLCQPRCTAKPLAARSELNARDGS